MRLRIVVRPNSKTDSIEKVGEEFIVRTKAPAVDNRANAAAIELIAKYVGAPKTRIKIIRGATSRHKVIEFEP